MEVRLLDPGLAVNSADAEHCVHACFQMVYRSRIGGPVPSYADLDVAMGKVPGKYTYEYGLLSRLPNEGFDVQIIWAVDLDLLAEDPPRFFLEAYGPSVGQEFIDNTALNDLAHQASELKASGVAIEHRPALRSDIERLVSNGYYVMCTINQRVLQADPGFVAHSILVFGYSERGPIIHNPGPPAVQASEIAWDLFERAWGYPDERAKNIMAVRDSGAR